MDHGHVSRVLRSASRRAIGVASRARIAPAAHPISIKEPREFPEATTRPTLPVTISDELVEFYAFVFCPGGFRRLDELRIISAGGCCTQNRSTRQWASKKPVAGETFSDEHPTEDEFQVGFECLWGFGVSCGVVRRTRLERIPGRRQRLVPIASCAIAPSGSAQFDEENCNG